MSEPIAETYVVIRPELAPNFAADLKGKLTVASAEAEKAAFVARANSKLSPGAQSLLARSGIADTFAGIAVAKKNTAQLAAEEERLSTVGTGLNRSLGSSRLAMAGIGFGALAALQGLSALSAKLRVTGEDALTTGGRLRNITSDLTAFKVEAVAAGTGELAALKFQGGARQAQDAAVTAQKRESELQRAIALAAEFVKVRAQAAKATGQQGTEEGVIKTQLEAQLRALRAQVALLPKNLNRTAFGQLGLGPNGANNPALIARTQRSTDQDFALRQLRAQQTKTSADDLALLTERRNFLKGLIGRIEEAGVVTESAKSNLQRLYGQLGNAEDQIDQLRADALARAQERLQKTIALAQTGVQIQAANARSQSQEIAALQAEANLARKYAADKRLDAQQRAQFELQAATADKQIFEIQQQASAAAKQKAEEEARIAEQERQQNEAKLQRQKDAAKQLRELRLENAIAKAGLTKSTADDKKAIQAQIRYYKELVKNTTGLEREQARSQLIAARASLKGLSANNSNNASAGDFFKEVLSDFRNFGSNFTSNGGPLSAQGARGQFAAAVLSNASTKSLQEALAEDSNKTGKQQLTEQKKQTVLLHSIAKGVNAGANTGVGHSPAVTKVPVGAYDSAVVGAGIVKGS